MKPSRKKKSTLLAFSWLSLWILAGILVTLFFRELGRHHLDLSLQVPSFAHPFGFDTFGRDLLLMDLKASVTSLFFAAFATLLCASIGIFFGTMIAVAPDRIQFASLRVLEMTLAFPFLLLALGWAALRGPGWDTLIVSLLIGTLPSFTRLIYARARELMAEDYILAARSIGANALQMISRHLIPNLLSLARVKIPNLFAQALIAEATLSFLGVGAPVGRDTWGSLLAQGQAYLLEAPHLTWGTGVPLVLTVLSLQLISEKSHE